MEDNNKILNYINIIKKNKLTREQTINYLAVDNTINNDSKNLIVSYCFPRPLEDYGLPPRVQKYREAKGTQGSTQIDNGEVILLVEAGQTQQYGRFIKHIMHAFCDTNKVIILDDEGTTDCAICGRMLRKYKTWKQTLETIPGADENKYKEWLSYGSVDSGVSICMNCIAQLVKAKEVMDILDPSFYDWTKRQQNKE